MNKKQYKSHEFKPTTNSKYYKDNILNKIKDDYKLLRRCTEEILLFILSQKGILSTQEIANKIKEKWTGIIIPRTEISKLFNGDFTNRLPNKVIENEIYKKAMELTVKRKYNKPKTEAFLEIAKNNSVKRRNFTEDQLMSIMKDKLVEYSGKTCGEKYIGKNGKKISEDTVRAIWTGKTIPLSGITDEYQQLLDFTRTRSKK